MTDDRASEIRGEIIKVFARHRVVSKDAVAILEDLKLTIWQVDYDRRRGKWQKAIPAKKDD